MMSFPVEEMLCIEFPQSKGVSFCNNHRKFWKDSLINKGIIPVSKQVHVFRHPVGVSVFRIIWQ